MSQPLISPIAIGTKISVPGIASNTGALGELSMLVFPDSLEEPFVATPEFNFCSQVGQVPSELKSTLFPHLLHGMRSAIDNVSFTPVALDGFGAAPVLHRRNR